MHGKQKISQTGYYSAANIPSNTAMGSTEYGMCIYLQHIISVFRRWFVT